MSAAASEGLDGAVARAKLYIEAGADAIFPEAMKDLSEFEAVASALDVPVLANMTEFGKSDLIDAGTLESIGYDAVMLRGGTARVTSFTAWNLL